MSSNDSSVRLNKYLALHEGLSRREADDLIANGLVTVNGQRAIIGARIIPDDKIEIKGKPIKSASLQYVMLNKPVGYVCSRKKQGNNPTIYELLPNKYHSLKPVGRLDRDSSGLIILTNDGDFALEMTHPRYGKNKRYEVVLNSPLEPLHQQMINDYGVELPDGKSKLILEKMSDNRMEWCVSMSEGRNRQIRRTFSALGYEVKKLHRTNFGPYNIGDTAYGKFVEVSKL